MIKRESKKSKLIQDDKILRYKRFMYYVVFDVTTSILTLAYYT